MLGKLLKRTLIMLGLLAILTIGVKAQALQQMTVAIGDASYATETMNIANVGAGDDNVYSWTMPFSFQFDNTWNTGVYISDNGYIVFSPYNYYYYYSSPYISQIWPSIQALATDLYVRGNLGIGVVGASPNRVVVFQWESVDFYYSYSANMNFQIKLYETSNKVELCYGQMNTGSFTPSAGQYTSPRTGFVGNSNSSWINIEGPSAWTAHFSSKNPSPNNDLSYSTTAGAIQGFAGKKIQLTAFPSLVDVYPKDGTIFSRGSIYSGARHPSMSFSRISGQADVYAYYKIAGPLPGSNPDYKVIYTGTNLNPSDELIYFNPQPVGSPAVANIPYAKGIAAGANGNFDLLTNQTSIPGGEYSVESQMYLPSFNYFQDFPTQKFIIALNDDLAITTFSSPGSRDDRKYPQTATIPVQCRVSNIGINDVYEFGVRINVYLNGQLNYTDTVHWSANPTPLHTGDFVNVNFTSFRPRIVGDYQVKVMATLLSASDQETSNNVFPRATQSDYYFTIAYEIEAEALSILAPTDSVYVKRPFIPRARFRNNGVSDMSDIPATMFIVRMFAPYDTVYRDNIIVTDIPSGKVNISDVLFSQNFIPPSAGTYKACVSINSPDDPVLANNSYCKIFQVIDAMAGTYTIGTTMSGSRNFNSIQEAVNALFQKGVTGPVTFELTDASYTTGDINMLAPAIDLSSTIIGAGVDNPITFKPASSRMIGKGSITINMYSGAGIGVQFGQNIAPQNSYSAVGGVTSSLKRLYAKSEGYFIFDGGAQKSIIFKLTSNNSFRAAFDMLEGSKYITIQNCLIQDASPILTSTSIPLTRYDATNTKFVYEADTRTGNLTYSSGVLMRARPPFDKGTDNSNSFRLDTMAINHILISNNEISGFGYGVTDLGIGPLKDAGPDKYKKYYNNNNEISGNLIYNVGRAGMFIGHEENSKFNYNKIYNVGGSGFADAAGIIAGGEGTASFNGYNNIGIDLNGNEISNVNSNLVTYGIKVEQDKNSYPYTNPSTIVYPDVPESVDIINNAIWGLNVANGSAARVGISLLTGRTTANTDFLTKMLTPALNDYWTRNDNIVNNTIRIPWDGGFMNSGATAGIAVQSATGVTIMNNAIALEDNDVLSTSPLYAAIFYQGQFPKNGLLKSDRNAFWSTSNSGASIYRFIETDSKNNVIDYFNRDDFKTLAQWQQWTRQDMNSVFGNFTGDLVYLGAEPNQRLRVQTIPNTPMGSILNNRGEKLLWNTNDIDGNVRGSAGQRYDIGASEFTGRMAITDVEALTITDPGAYKVNLGTFADAEYIMTKAPVEVKALVRNNGNIQQTGVVCRVRAYRELPNGTFSSSQEIEKTITVDMSPSETAVAAFKLDDYLTLNWYPRTYGELRGSGYILPDPYVSMEANVTPRYKIEVSVQSDQNNANNIVTKVVRFYLMKSNTRICMSNENSMTTLTGSSTQEQIAGRLNYDSVMKAFKRFGWKIAIDADPPVYDYDVFDRFGWEPKAVNYTMFRTVVWSDGVDKALTRFQRADMRNFLNQGNTIEKKNLIAGSQELVRQLSQNNSNKDIAFLQDVFRATSVAPENPKGVNGDNNGNSVIGVALERNLIQFIKATGYTNDTPPYCGLMSVSTNGEGLALPGYYYVNKNAGLADSTVGVAVTTLTRNAIVLGVDWRHWAKIDMVFRAVIDFIEKNGGTIIPVELLDFKAVAAGNRVDLNWSTASEYKSDKFDIERATLSQIGKTDFVKIADEKAAGKSEAVRHYGPVVDRNVELGNRYVYRLKMIDLDGTYKYSNEVEVSLDGSGTWLGVATPNPASSNVSLTYSVSQDANISINLFDVTGKNIMPVFNGLTNAGEHPVTFDVSNLPAGSYTIVFNSGNSTLIRQIQIVR